MTQPEHVNVEVSEDLCRRIENILPDNPKAGRSIEDFMTDAAARYMEFLKSTLPDARTETSQSTGKDDKAGLLKEVAAETRKLVDKTREDDEYSHGAVEAGWTALDGDSAPTSEKEKDHVVKDLAEEFRKLKNQPRGSS